MLLLPMTRAIVYKCLKDVLPALAGRSGPSVGLHAEGSRVWFPVQGTVLSPGAELCQEQPVPVRVLLSLPPPLGRTGRRRVG